MKKYQLILIFFRSNMQNSSLPQYISQAALFLDLLKMSAKPFGHTLVSPQGNLVKRSLVSTRL